MKHYPNLKKCGGFEVLYCLPNSKSLEVVLSNDAFSPSLLKTVIGAGRPIQIDKDMSPQHFVKRKNVVSTMSLCMHMCMLTFCVCMRAHSLCVCVRACVCVCVHIFMCTCLCV